MITFLVSRFSFLVSRAWSLWLLAPVLAMLAWAPVLRLWFVSDDFGHLLFHESFAFPAPLLAFDSDMFYRPLSTVLTWNIGYALFGTHSLPYHIVTLLVHAFTAFMLARAVRLVSGSELTGWLAGALFGVYPLCTEPLAWLAAQWDVLAGACVVGAVWAFAVAWRSGDRRAYTVALVCVFLAVGMKESALPVPLIIPFVALTLEMTGGTSEGRPRSTKQAALNQIPSERTRFLKRLAVWSLPFAIPSVLFVGLRLYGLGSLGGYAGANTDFHTFFWDAFMAGAFRMLMPLNRQIFDSVLIQFVGLSVTVTLVVGIGAFARRKGPVLMLGAVWWIVFLLPVLGMVPVPADERNVANRIFYISLMGFCIVLAAALGGFLEVATAKGRTAQIASWSALGVALLGAVVLTWGQLQPWVHASEQTRQTVQELGALVAPAPGQVDMYVVNLPTDYRGAYTFRNGFDTAMLGFNHQLIGLDKVTELDAVGLAKPLGSAAGRYNLGLSRDPADFIYYVNELAGVTILSDPPAGSKLWDFRKCASGGVGTKMTAGWQPSNARAECQDGYLAFAPTGDGASLGLPDLQTDLSGARWLRLGVAARYPDARDAGQDLIGEWSWHGTGQPAQNQARSKSFHLDAEGQWRVYWTYIKAEQIGPRLESLSFVPVTGQHDSQLSWIALDIIGR